MKDVYGDDTEPFTNQNVIDCSHSRVLIPTARKIVAKTRTETNRAPKHAQRFPLNSIKTTFQSENPVHYAR